MFNPLIIGLIVFAIILAGAPAGRSDDACQRITWQTRQKALSRYPWRLLPRFRRWCLGC
jgi:hypothetical protein